jgi:hypothetical protein
MKHFIYIAILSFLNTVASAQALKFRFQVDHEKTGIARSTNLIANGEGIITDYSGNFQLTLNPSINNIRVQSPDERKYVIKYPKDGIILLPRNATDVIRIIIDEPGKEEISGQIKKQIAGSLAKLESRLKRIEGEDANMRRSILASMDSLLKEAQKNNITETELRTAREIIAGKDKYFPEISFSLSTYVNEAKDLSDAFKQVQLAFKQRKAYEQLISSVNSYNKSYEKLNAEKDAYEKAILDYWQSRELSLNFLNIIDFALNEIHRPYVLPLNDVLERINNHHLEKKKRVREKMEKEIVEQLDQTTTALDRRLNILAEKANTLITILKSLQEN